MWLYFQSHTEGKADGCTLPLGLCFLASCVGLRNPHSLSSPPEALFFLYVKWVYVETLGLERVQF